MSTLEDPLASHESNGVENRRQRRICFQQQAWAMELTHPDERHSVLTQDLSVNGVGFITIHPFPQNSWIIICMTFESGAQRKILCRAKRCASAGNGFYCVGAEFEAAVPNDPPSFEVPKEWLDMANRSDQPNIPMPKNKAVLDEALIPGVFTEPTIQVLYDDV